MNMMKNNKPLRTNQQRLSISTSAGVKAPVESKDDLRFNLPDGNYNKPISLLSTPSAICNEGG